MPLLLHQTFDLLNSVLIRSLHGVSSYKGNHVTSLKLNVTAGHSYCLATLVGNFLNNWSQIIKL